MHTAKHGARCKKTVPQAAERQKGKPHPSCTQHAPCNRSQSVCGWKIWEAASLRYLPMSLTTLARVRTDRESWRGVATRGRAAGFGAGAGRRAAAGRALATTMVAFIVGCCDLRHADRHGEGPA